MTIDQLSRRHLDGNARLHEFSVTYWTESGEHHTTVDAVDRHDAERRVRARFSEPTPCLAD
jgi:hypothetical protein